MIYQITFHDIMIKHTTVHNPFNTGVWLGAVQDICREITPELYPFFHERGQNYPKIHFRNHGNGVSLVAFGKEAYQQLDYFSDQLYHQYQRNVYPLLIDSPCNYPKHLQIPTALHHIGIQQVVYTQPLLHTHLHTYEIPYYILSKKLNNLHQYTTVAAVANDKNKLEKKLTANFYELLHKTLGLEVPEYRLHITKIANLQWYQTFKKAPPTTTLPKPKEKGVCIQLQTNLNIPELTAIAGAKAIGYGCVYKKKGVQYIR